MGSLRSGGSGHAVIDFSPDGGMLVVHQPESVVVWDVRTRQQKRSVAIPLCSSNAVRWSPNGALITQSAEGSLQFVDADSGRVLSECPPGTAGMGQAFHPSGVLHAASAWDASIRLLDSRTGRELISLHKHTQFTREILLTPDGNTLISSDWTGHIFVWDLTYYDDSIRRELERRIATEQGR